MKTRDTGDGYDYVIDKELIAEIFKEHTMKFLYQQDVLIENAISETHSLTGFIK